MLTLVASAARVASGNSGTLTVPAHPELLEHARFWLDVTVAATDVSDTLDVYVQTTFDAGTTWDDLVHFTQVLGNGGAKNYVAAWFKQTAPESEVHAPQDAAIAAGVVQGGRMGTNMRVKWVIVDPGAGAVSFTFSVSANFSYAGR